jgi:hypothetical protein
MMRDWCPNDIRSLATATTAVEPRD